jgi:hypothetical protein
MRFFFVAALFFIGCGGQTTAGPKEIDEAPRSVPGGPGSVCKCAFEGQGAGTQNACKAVQCNEGLICGYGCGIPGCDSTCMTPKEYEGSKNIP